MPTEDLENRLEVRELKIGGAIINKSRLIAFFEGANKG